MSGLTDAQLMVLSSVQIYQTRPAEKRPIGFGSGFKAKYRDRLFFISVSHVTDKGELENYLETNIYDNDQKAWIWKKIGGFCYFSLIDGNQVTAPDDLLKLIENGKEERLDICFTELKSDIPLLQLPMDFRVFKVGKTEKITLDLDYVAVPDRSERYGFYGKIRHNVGSRVHESQPTLKHTLDFQCELGDFYILLAPEIIKDEYDYKGCSGAPVLDSEQNLIGVASAVKTDTKIIYVFSIQRCKQLIDYAIEMGMLDIDQSPSDSETSV
ncbi:hypothetical protein HDF19_00735 [Mucilaginibacter sp. E4BP6]|uniref:hypothetical protein n=1 Tax=Mucilaginibacter sp. E4BP6 TaxID=2723089 RepID=UPI0015C8EB89|nr:hypothetical protein [Mucilaginibacter sp. E4BP6]NYE66895.1 hypothetical protein [Mucilaginibacter sp. E4BP6]